jgi:hypothetical protein
MYKLRSIFLVMSFLLGSLSISIAQSIEGETNWDNLIYFGNKVTWGQKKWMNSGELQVRLQDNHQQLLQWQLEYVGTYLASKHIEIAPDFRYTVKPDRKEFRPGLGVVLKHMTNKGQFAHQIKGQIDFKTVGETTQVIRYFPSYNHIFSEKWIGSVIGGFYYKFTNERSDIEVVMGGLNAAYVMDKKHTLNLSYVYGQQLQFATDEYIHFGIIMARLIININKEYDYLPAKYINF